MVDTLIEIETSRDIEVKRPVLPESPRPFALRFAEVSDQVHDKLALIYAGDQPTVYPTYNWADMLTATD